MLKDRRRPLTCLLLFILILTIYSVTVYAYEIDESFQVTRIIDGDSFEVSGDEVRLADVSAPEWDMPGGTEATNALSNLISGEIVFLNTDQKSGRGPYGRLIAVVYIIHNSTHYKNVNEALLRLGVVSETDYTNNEFSPSTWALFVRYASTPPPPPPPLPPFISDLTVTPPELELGENVTIGLDVMNPNNQSINYIVTMKIGELTLLVDVELGAYESETVSRTISPYTVGDFYVTVDGMTGNYTVRPPPKPAEFEFSNFEITPEEVELGMNVTISVEVTNVGEEMGGCTVELKLDGEVVDSVEITPFGGVPPDYDQVTATQFFKLMRGEGTYEVEVEGLTGSFTVKPEPSFWDKIPGFPYESIIIGLIAIIVIIWRARKF